MNDSIPVSEVEPIVAADLEHCTPEQRALFAHVRVDPYHALLDGAVEGKDPTFVVVAHFDGEVMYWEHVEEGFNVSPVGPGGSILKHWCNQDSLAVALRRWESS